jgi:hypothetical protein
MDYLEDNKPPRIDTESPEMYNIPKNQKYVYTHQQYIPVVKDVVRTKSGVRFGVHGLTMGSVISYKDRLYSILEIRQHGVVIREDAYSDPYMIVWNSFIPARITKALLKRMNFVMTQMRFSFRKKEIRVYTKRIGFDLFAHYEITKGMLIIGDVLLYRRIRYVHELQHLLYALSGDVRDKYFVFKNKSRFYTDGYIANMMDIKPVKKPMDNILHTETESDKRRFRSKKFVTPTGMKKLVTRPKNLKHVKTGIKKESFHKFEGQDIEITWTSAYWRNFINQAMEEKRKLKEQYDIRENNQEDTQEERD